MDSMSTSHHAVNPWTWQDQFGFAQAISAPPWLFCAGQGPADPDGNDAPRGYWRSAYQSLDNLETVLAQAGTDLSHVVRLNYYTTDVDGLFGVWQSAEGRIIAERLQKANCAPPKPCSASLVSPSPTC